MRAVLHHFAFTTHTHHWRKCTNHTLVTTSREGDTRPSSRTGTRILHDLKRGGACQPTQLGRPSKVSAEEKDHTSSGGTASRSAWCS